MASVKEQKYMAAFGKHLAELRRSYGYTQAELAEKVDMATHSLALIEQGQRWPRLITLHSIAKVLKMPTKELLDGLKQ